MSFLIPLGLLACSALWIKGLRSLWQRALLLVAFLGLLFVLLPSVTQETGLVNLAIYQQEAREFAVSVATRIERGDSEGAKKQLRHFSENQDASTANDPAALRSFYKDVELAGQSSVSPAAEAPQAPAPK